MSQSAPTPPADPSIAFRSPTREEIHDWITPSWIASYSHRLPAKMMRADTPRGYGRQRFWTATEGKIRRLMAVPDVAIRVAEVDGVSAGWCCEDRKQKILHYVYVKDTFRRQGVGTALVGWIEDSRDGLVIIAAMPPQWFTERGEDPTRDPYKPHQIIDIVTPY